MASGGQEFRRLGHEIVDLVADYLERLSRGEGPVFQRMSAEARARVLSPPLPATGQPEAEILTFLREAVMPYPMGNGHPRFFGWVNSAPAPLAVLTELIATAMNPSCAGGDHAGVYLEHCAVRWLAELLGYRVGSSVESSVGGEGGEGGPAGILTSGGSMATLTGLAAARHRAAQGGGWDVRAGGLAGQRRLVLYMSSEGHSCIRKAAELLGLGAPMVIPVDADLRMDVAALCRAIARDRGLGRLPFCVVASAGTVNTGAVDPLGQLADVCAREGLWLHVDGAYGAPGRLDPRAAPLYEGLERADSLGVDPHKWLAVPVECGCAFVRDGQLLREAFSVVPPYLRVSAGRGFGQLPWFSEYGFQQTRGFRALKLWVTLSQLGRAGAAALVSRHNDLAQRLAAAIWKEPDLELLAPVTLSVVCFRYAPVELDSADQLDTLNRALVEVVQEEGEVFLTGTELRGQAALRACVLHHETSEADVDRVVEVVRKLGARLRGAAG